MEKLLNVNISWDYKFEIGLFKIVNQMYRGESFVEFIAENGVRICSEEAPEIMGNEEESITFYVRGRAVEKDNETVTTTSYDIFLKVYEAIYEYNTRMAEKAVDYLDLHKRVWNKLADSGSTDKSLACEEVMKEIGLAKAPINFCFLCALAGYNPSNTEPCDSCIGYWGPGTKTCVDQGSYYTIWRLEADPELRKALARRIANNCASSLVSPEELNVALNEGRIPAIKMFRARTGMGLKASKDAIEKAMD